METINEHRPIIILNASITIAGGKIVIDETKLKVVEINPRYEHNCNHCKFLGQHEEYDLYYCPQGGNPTILARFSDKDQDYTSGVGFKHIEPLKVAKRLADAFGYEFR